MFLHTIWKLFTRDLFGSLLIFSTLLLLWFLISGSFGWQHFVTGIVVAWILTLFWSHMTVHEVKRTRFNWHQIKLLFRCLSFLELEVLKANFVVAYLVLSPKMPISPGLIIFNFDLKRDLTRVLYANAITLTPGTITVDMEDDRLLVHGMTKEHAFGVRKWYLYDIIKDLEESAVDD
jgi:multicomponent Na+:H+ antiporter subunit E